MKDVEGVYQVVLLGPYGWEGFSTAFVSQGQYRSASADHFTDGVYQVEGKRFSMVGKLTQYAEHGALFGVKYASGLPIEFNGTIRDGVIDGEANVVGGTSYAHRFRFNKLRSPRPSKPSGGGSLVSARQHTVHDELTVA